MTTTFNISSTFPISTERAKELTRFCIKLARARAREIGMPVPRQLHFNMCSSSSNTRSGNAHINKRSYRNHRQNVFIKLGKKWGVSGIVVERYRRYRHRADCPTCVTDGRDEAFLHLVAHELGHGLCGFQGDMTGEYQCELFALRVLEEYRLATRDPACMI